MFLDGKAAWIGVKWMGMDVASGRPVGSPMSNVTRRALGWKRNRLLALLWPDVPRVQNSGASQFYSAGRSASFVSSGNDSLPPRIWTVVY